MQIKKKNFIWPDVYASRLFLITRDRALILVRVPLAIVGRSNARRLHIPDHRTPIHGIRSFRPVIHSFHISSVPRVVQCGSCNVQSFGHGQSRRLQPSLS